MSEIQRRALNALAKLPDELQEKALIRLEATADAVEQVCLRTLEPGEPVTSAKIAGCYLDRAKLKEPPSRT